VGPAWRAFYTESVKDSAHETSFTDALRRLLRVPKHELDAEERKHHAEMAERRETRQSKKSG
jgi:hypothetical protein